MEKGYIKAYHQEILGIKEDVKSSQREKRGYTPHIEWEIQTSLDLAVRKPHDGEEMPLQFARSMFS